MYNLFFIIPNIFSFLFPQVIHILWTEELESGDTPGEQIRFAIVIRCKTKSPRRFSFRGFLF
jgi:hypothetical protein